MALVKKKSRLITLDGVTYRWRVRGKPTYAQAITQSPLTFAVEQVDQHGATLLVQMPQNHPSSWLNRPARPVLPSTVASIIRQALQRGWQPHVPGPTFYLDARQAINPSKGRQLTTP